MKTKFHKILFGALALALFSSPLYSADQWDKTAPAGSSQRSDIDLNVTTNNKAVDRMLSRYREGAYAYASSINQFIVSAGDVMIPNAAGTVRRMRSNTSTTTVTWADIDTGAEANSTVYHYYAVADTDIDGFTITISANSTTPTGKTYYRKLGAVYNNSAGSLEVGGIIEMYSGFLTALPTGYVLCDGTNGTVDLSDRFVIGTKTGSTVGAVGTSGGDLTSSGSTIRTATAADSDATQPDGTDGSSESSNTHSHKYPKYYALAFIQRQGVE